MASTRQTHTSLQAAKSSDSAESIYSENFLEKIKDIVKAEMKTEINTRIADVVEQLAEVNEEVKALKELHASKVSAINNKLENLEFELKSVANVRQQRERDEGVMIYDLPLPDSTGYNTVAQANYIFDTIFFYVFHIKVHIKIKIFSYITARALNFLLNDINFF